MRSLCLSVVFVVSVLAFGGCASCPRASFEVVAEPGANPWTSLDVNNDPDRFQFAIMSDRAGGIRPGVFERAVTALNRLQP